MPSLVPLTEQRRTPRIGLKVIHRHRIGPSVVRRVSELVLSNGRAVALLEWIDLGGVRTPLYTCELELSMLRAAHRGGMYQYDGVTVDPRFQDARPATPDGDDS